MNQRQLAVILLASVLAACGTPLENATSTFKEQVRLGDPDAQQTFADNRELFESAEALPIWLDALANADSPQVQLWAATLIGNIGDSSALPALADARMALSGWKARSKTAPWCAVNVLTSLFSRLSQIRISESYPAVATHRPSGEITAS